MARPVLVLFIAAACLGPLATARADDAKAAYRTIFGAEERKVAASPSKKDDVAFASRLLKRAEEVPDTPALQALLYEKAYEFAAKDRAGYATALEALRRLGAAQPKRRAEWENKLLKLCELRFRRARGEERIAAGRELLGRLLDLADAAAEAGRAGEALERYRQAARVAPRVEPGRAKEIAQRMRELAALERVEKEQARLEKSLKDDPQNAALALRLLMLHLVDRDDPAKAAELADLAAPGEPAKTLLPMASRPWNELGAEPAMALARWYESLADKAAPAARGRMLARARVYYQTYLTLHGARDAAALAARVRLGKVEKRLQPFGHVEAAVAGPPKGVSAKIIAWAKRRDAMSPAEQLEALPGMLAKANGGNRIKIVDHRIVGGRIVRLGFREEKNLRSLAPLWGMKLTELDLAGTAIEHAECLAGMELTYLDAWECRSLTSLKGLEGMPLRKLVLAHTQVADLEPLRGMKLTSLHLDGSKRVKSIEPLRGMPLETLSIHVCPEIASIEPIRGMKLRTLHISAVKAIKRPEDLGPIRGMPLILLHIDFAPFRDLKLLEGMPLESLKLYGAKSLRTLDGLEKMPLAWLDLRKTRFATKKVVVELKRRITTLKEVLIQDE